MYLYSASLVALIHCIFNICLRARARVSSPMQEVGERRRIVVINSGGMRMLWRHGMTWGRCTNSWVTLYTLPFYVVLVARPIHHVESLRPRGPSGAKELSALQTCGLALRAGRTSGRPHGVAGSGASSMSSSIAVAGSSHMRRCGLRWSHASVFTLKR